LVQLGDALFVVFLGDLHLVLSVQALVHGLLHLFHRYFALHLAEQIFLNLDLQLLRFLAISMVEPLVLGVLNIFIDEVSIDLLGRLELLPASLIAVLHIQLKGFNEVRIQQLQPAGDGVNQDVHAILESDDGGRSWLNGISVLVLGLAVGIAEVVDFNEAGDSCRYSTLLVHFVHLFEEGISRFLDLAHEFLERVHVALAEGSELQQELRSTYGLQLDLGELVPHVLFERIQFLWGRLLMLFILELGRKGICPGPEDRIRSVQPW